MNWHKNVLDSRLNLVGEEGDISIPVVSENFTIYLKALLAVVRQFVHKYGKGETGRKILTVPETLTNLYFGDTF